MKPNFIGIGAQKCASTWLYDILADHPQVGLSSAKEIDFFSNFFDYGAEWYERNFADAGGRVARGEISPSYFHGVSVPERVHAYDPDMRLILFVREPIARAISNHKHEVRIGHLQGDDLSFEYGLANNPMYIEQGRYATHLERWLQYFPREQLLIVLFDDVHADGASVARRVYEFLGVDSAHISAALGERSNESYVNRSSIFEGAKNVLRRAVRGARLGWLWQLIGNLGFRQAYRSANRADADMVIPAPHAATRAQLEQVFAQELVRFEQLSGLSCDCWRVRQQEAARG
jgi:hypothetical protein